MKPAEIFPPGDFIADEMQVREWSITDLASRASLSVFRLNQILGGDKMRLHECGQIASAFEQNPALWANLNLAWAKWQRKKQVGVERCQTNAPRKATVP